jgi:hypothetical protein
VQVRGGTLSGPGTIAGAVIIGRTAGVDTFLTPGNNGTRPGRLTIKQSLDFEATGIYKVVFDSEHATMSVVRAKDVRIVDASILLNDIAGNVIAAGTIFTVIDNTAATPIDGTFTNLPDGGTIRVHSNTFQANYEGGDGNDLTLTVLL